MAIAQVKTRITLVRIAVARFESTPSTPTFASNAVAAANTAESSAQKTQVMPMRVRLPVRRNQLELSGFQVDLLPVPTLYSRPDLGRCLADLCLLVGIDRLAHARRTGSAMGPFEATMQAVMSHLPVATAVAGLLVQDCGNLCRHLVCRHLVWMREVHTGQLVT